MKLTRSMAVVALTVLAAVACGRVTAENVVEVTLEQAARELSDLGVLVNGRTAPLVAALEELPGCPEQQEPVFEMSGFGLGGGRPADPVDARAWDNYIRLLRSCRSQRDRLISSYLSTASRVETLRRVYGSEYLETTFVYMRERITSERLERNDVSLERLAAADLQARWEQLHYVAYERSYGFRSVGMLDYGTWPDIDEEQVEHLLDVYAEEIDDRVFDIRDLSDDAMALYERMARGEHR